MSVPRRLPACLLATGVLVLSVTFAFIFAQVLAQALEQTWRTIVEARQTNQSAIISLEYRYTLDMHGMGVRQLSEEKLAIQGDKTFNEMQIKEHNMGAAGKLVESSFDGKLTYSRQDGILTSTARDGATRMHHPQPWRIIEWRTPAELDDEFKSGQAAIKSIDRVNLNGFQCLHVTIEGYAYIKRRDIWYDTERGYWPVLQLDTFPENKIAAKAEIQQIVKRTVDGMDFFVPTHYRSQSWRSDGSQASDIKITIDGDSVQVNQPIPDERFVLVPREGDLVVFETPDIYPRSIEAIARGTTVDEARGMGMAIWLAMLGLVLVISALLLHARQRSSTRERGAS